MSKQKVLREETRATEVRRVMYRATKQGAAAAATAATAIAAAASSRMPTKKSAFRRKHRGEIEVIGDIYREENKQF